MQNESTVFNVHDLGLSVKSLSLARTPSETIVALR